MVPAVFSIIFDHAQTRVQRHPSLATINGLGWNGEIFENTWLDPITHTLMLRPMCKFDAWQARTSGIDAKPNLASYEFETSANWQEFEVINGGGQAFVQGAASGNPGWIRTATAPGLNRGVNLAFFGYGAGDNVQIGEFGWHNTVTTVSGSEVAGKIFADGTVEIYKGGTLIKFAKVGFGGTGAKDVPVELLLLPMRRKELLVLGSGDVGFVAVFDDIDEDEASPVIVPNQKFWFRMFGTEATRAQVQIAPLKFPSSGFANSVLVNFQRPPASGATLQAWTNPVFTSITSANVYGNTAFAGTTDVTSVALVEDDGATAFVPDGTLNTARIKLSMTGDGNYTPFVYGAVMQYQGTTAETDDSEEADLDDYLVSFSMSVGDGAFDTSARAVYRFPQAASAVVAKLKTIGNRPVKVVCGSVVLIDGRAGEPRFIKGLQDDSSYVEFEIFDLSAQLEDFVFRDEYPLDGFYLSREASTGESAVETVAKLAGLEVAELNLTTDTYRLPEVPGQICEEFSYPVRVGEDAREAIENLHSNFAANWFIGVRPTATVPQLFFKSPADMGTTPKMVVYAKNADAVSASMPSTQVYQSFEIQTEQVSANEIWVTGQDPRTGKIIQRYLIDESSQDATTLPSLRPDNWWGGPRIYAVQDPRFRTQTDLQRAIDLLAPAVTSKRVFGQMETSEMLWYNADPGGTDLMLPLWRGDFVDIDGEDEYQITSLTFSVVRNNADALVTSAQYTFGGMTNAGGNSLASIQQKNRLKYELAYKKPFLTSGLIWSERVRRPST